GGGGSPPSSATIRHNGVTPFADGNNDGGDGRQHRPYPLRKKPLRLNSMAARILKWLFQKSHFNVHSHARVEHRRRFQRILEGEREHRLTSTAALLPGSKKACKSEHLRANPSICAFQFFMTKPDISGHSRCCTWCEIRAAFLFLALRRNMS